MPKIYLIHSVWARRIMIDKCTGEVSEGKEMYERDIRAQMEGKS